MSHCWPDGLPIEVVCDPLEAPARLRLRGRWHTVVEITARWRVRRHWWRAPRWREYVTVATESRLLLTLVRELPRGAWVVMVIFD